MTTAASVAIAAVAALLVYSFGRVVRSPLRRWWRRRHGSNTELHPIRETARDGSPALTIAGLWDEWEDKTNGETLNSCTMIITGPNEFVSEVHDRMPVLLAEKDCDNERNRMHHGDAVAALFPESIL